MQTLNAIDAASCDSLWSAPLGDQLFSLCKLPSSPAVANDVVYAASNAGGVYALDAGDGAVLWQWQQGSRPITASPAVADGVLYIASRNRGVFAIGLLP